MPLYSNPPHTVAILTQTNARDSAGGTNLTYVSAQSDVPCSINTASADTVRLYLQDGIRVTHSVAFLSSVLSSTLARGSKLTSGSSTFHVEGIRTGRAYGSIPAFTYADCSELL